MSTLGWLLVGVGSVLLGIMCGAPPEDDRRGAHLLFAAFFLLGLGALMVFAGRTHYEPVGGKRSGTLLANPPGLPYYLAPIAGSPLSFRIESAHRLVERRR